MTRFSCSMPNICPILAKPFLDGPAMKNLRLKVGETIVYNIKIGGEPPPETQWFANDKELKSAGRVKIITQKTLAIIKIEKAERSDSGKYTLRVFNPTGEESATSLVVVIGKPDKPKGPLEVKDVHGSGCTLAWEPPADDGGEPMEGKSTLINAGSDFLLHFFLRFQNTLSKLKKEPVNGWSSVALVRIRLNSKPPN